MSKKLLVNLFFSFIFLFTGASLVHAASYSLPVTGIRDYDWANDALAATNEARKSANLNVLKMDAELQEAAMKRAYEIALYFDHTRPNGKSFYTMVDSNTMSASAENIAANVSNGTYCVNEVWMKSAGHKKNILGSDWKSIGIGVAKIENGGAGTYLAVQMFSRYDTANISNKSGKSDTVVQDVEIIDTYINDYSLKITSYNDLTGHYYVEVGNPLNIRYIAYMNNENYSVKIPSSVLKYQNYDTNYLTLKDGVLTGLKEGRTSFTGTMLGKSKNYDVDVGYLLDTFKVDNYTIKVNESKKIVPNIVPSNATIYELNYSSDSPNIVDVTDGFLVGKNTGQAKITVSGMAINKKIATSFTVKVEENISLKLNYSNYQINSLGETLQLEAKLSNGNAANDVTWSTKDSNIVSVVNGKVTPLRGGFARVTAKSAKYGSSECLIYVSVPVSLSDGSKGYIGDLNRDGHINAIDSSLISDYLLDAKYNEDINILGDINNNGYIDLEDNTSIIDIYTLNFFSTNGYKEIIDVTLDRKNLTLKINGNDNLVATINPIDTTDSNKLTWKSSNKIVAEVDENGRVRGLNNGTSEITVTTSNGKSAKCLVTVGTGINEYIKGDLDESGDISVIDAVEALYYSIGKRDVTNHKLLIGDFDNDKEITVIDAIEILKLLIK